MKIKKSFEDKTLTIAVSGRIDSTTAPEFEEAIKKDMYQTVTLILDFRHVEYVSSAGLRVLLMACKIMKNQGEMKIINTPQTVKEVFDMTGLSNFLDVQ